MATYKHIRSSTAHKRPTTSIADGQIAINTNTASPGLFFKDSAGTGIVKVGPVHVGTSAPNASPAVGGSTGNYLGEQWLDTSLTPAQLKVWNGSAWVGVVADELPVSKLEDGQARQLLQTDAAGTGVEWTSNVDVPGTLDVTGATTLDSTLTVPLGSAAAPTVRFTGDTNTGIYSPGADQLALSTNGAGRLFVDASGDISLANNLKFSRTSPAEITVDSGGNIFISADSANTTAASSINLNVDGTEVADFNNAGYLRFNKTGFANAGICTQQLDDVLRLGGGNNPLSSGTNVAISGPDHVSTSAGLLVRDGTAIKYSWTRAADNHIFYTGAGSERLRITSAGLVGIGTSSPANDFVVSNGGAAGFEVNPTVGVGVLYYNRSTSQYIDATHDCNQFIVTRGSSERFRCDSSGRLLVGTSSARTVNASVPSVMVVEAAGGGGEFVSFIRNANDAFAGIINIGKSRGSAVNSVATVQNNDILARLTFSGADGTTIRYAAEISAAVDGIPGADDMPGRLVFSTTPDGSTSPVERMRIKSNGIINFSNAPVYADNTAALAGGLVAGDVYRKSDGTLMITY